MRTERKNDSLAGLRLYALSQTEEIPVIHVDGAICAGFPSPADDYLETQIDLRAELIRNPDATFIVRVQGNSMSHDGIDDGDVLIVDRSVKPRNGAVAVCYLNNNFTVKRLEQQGARIRLLAANPAFPPIEIEENDELVIWGVVTYVIKKP
ncbi:MAG: translesion error-prone DNA polymerase V autoproteolytic subunit [Saprospiraceae bacterium]|nr:translesion error-prone DNA polymerase V autoproteolytic subunit [Saprospiraceae bacterium]MCB0574318.1 translesion error-prone DNA polymerase V autoproteolytic subunit [Saprospiraceae bacterium]MCB9356460.1 translesion error-prone DNA polymerase V autoproteolytic subunit [Lewinellaceae bacterium]